MSTRIRVAERVADILSCFSTEQPELGVLEISDKLNLDQATVCRILLTLKDKGFVSSDPITRKYTIGPKLAQIAQIGIGNTNSAQSASHMHWLEDQTNETVPPVSALTHNGYVSNRLKRQEIRRIIRVRRPTAVLWRHGKMLLASMPDERSKLYRSNHVHALPTQPSLAPISQLRSTDPTKRVRYRYGRANSGIRDSHGRA